MLRSKSLRANKFLQQITNINEVHPLLQDKTAIADIIFRKNISLERFLPFLLCEEYYFLVDEFKTLEDNLGTIDGGKYKYIIEEMEKSTGSVLETRFDGKDILMGYFRMTNGQIIGVSVPYEEVFKA